MRPIALLALLLLLAAPASAQSSPSRSREGVGGRAAAGREGAETPPASETETGTGTGSGTGTETGSESESESESEPGSETGTESESGSESEPGPGTEPATGTESVHEDEDENEDEDGDENGDENGDEDGDENGDENGDVHVHEDEDVHEDEGAGAAVPRGPCAQDLRSRPVGPLQVGDLDGNLGVAHRACPREELAIGGDLLLVAQTAEFYGNIRVNGRARISAPIFDPRVEAFLSWEAFRYQTVISSVAAAYTGLGYLSWGAAGQVYVDDERVVAVTGRMVLPTTTGLDQHGQPLALDLGVTAAYQVDPNLRLHFWLTLLGSVGIGGPAEPKGGVRVGGGLDWRPFEWLSFVLELQNGFGYRDALDMMAVQAGVRLALGTELGLELAGSLPFLGWRALDAGATPLAASLMLSWYLR